MMDPLFAFGMGVALVGCGAIGTALNACKEVLSLSRVDGAIDYLPLLGAMLFILLIDIGILAAGLWIAVAIAGGAHG
jgi:hypothetical protein